MTEDLNLSNFSLDTEVLTLIIKSINSIDAGTFVVSSEKKKILGIFDFVRQ